MAPAKILPLQPTGPGSAAWWTSQLDWATEVRRDLLPGWRIHTNAYRDKLIAKTPEGIRVNIEFEKTEQKKHQLFYRLPALKLRAHPRTLRETQQAGPGVAPRDLRKAVSIFREVLAQLVGPKGANTKAAMDEVLFDVLCPAGLGFVKVGYERYIEGTVSVQTGFKPDPNFVQPGSVLGLREAPMVPTYGSVPNVIAERYYCSRISPAKALIPPDFTGSDYRRDADYLGHDFFIRRDAAIAKGWDVPKDASGAGGEDEDRIVELTQKGDRTDQLRAREVFYYASRIDPDVQHPDKIRRLVFLHGVTEPVVHEDFQDQRFDDRGRFIGGLRTLPIHVLALRYVSDTPYPPSDCAITRRQSDELAEFRTQMIVHRRKAVAMRWRDINMTLDERVTKMLDDGQYYGTVPTDGPGDKFMGEIARAQYPRENYAANDYIMNDVNRAWSLGANQAAIRESAGTTATEIASIQNATETRLGAEREKVVGEFWIGIVEAEAQLVQLYADREDYVEIVGEDGTKAIEAWNRETVQGEFLFEVIPNSAAQPDAAADRALALNRYNLLANDPFTNREQLVRDTYEALEGDPDRLVRPPNPTPPEKPRLSVTISGDDLNPGAPQYANVVSLLTALGVPALQPVPGGETGEVAGEPTGPPTAVDRERLQMGAEPGAPDGRSGGLVGVGG